MMVSGKIFAILAILTITCALWSADVAENYLRDHSVFAADRSFGAMIPADPKGRWSSDLPPEIRQLKIPDAFLIEEVVAKKNKDLLKISLLNDTLSIEGERLIALYSRKTLPGFRHWKIEVEIAGKGSAGIGFYGYGRFSQHHLPTEEIASDDFQKKTFTFQLEQAPQTSYVRIVLLAKGKIRFRNVKVFSAPLPPEWSQAEGKITALFGNQEAALLECTAFGEGAPVPQRLIVTLPPPEKGSKWEKGDFVSAALVPLAEENSAEMEMMEKVLPRDVRHLPRRIARYATDRPSVRKSGIDNTAFLSTPPPQNGSANTPLSDAQKAAMEDLRRQELQKVDAMIAEVISGRNQKNMAFQKDWRIRQRQYQPIGNTGLIWVNENGCFFALPQRYVLLAETRLSEAVLQKLEHWNRMLAAKEITLIVQVIPYFYDVAARALNPEWSRVPDLSSAMVVKQLLERNIQAQYLTDRIVERAREGELLFAYPRKSAPMAGVWQIAADAAAERLAPIASQWTPDRLPELFLVHSEPSQLRWSSGLNVHPHLPGSPVTCRMIRYSGEKIASDSASPVLVVGTPVIAGPVDSGGYGAFFAMKMQMFPHILHSSDFNFIERMYIYSDIYCKGKQAVVFPVLISDLMSPEIATDFTICPKEEI